MGDSPQEGRGVIVVRGLKAEGAVLAIPKPKKGHQNPEKPQKPGKTVGAEAQKGHQNQEKPQKLRKTRKPSEEGISPGVRGGGVRVSGGRRGGARTGFA